ncbi:MAG: FkbM family methyltransferase [Thermodesulfobacteriota bacterium]
MRYINLIKNISNWWLHFQIKFGRFNQNTALWRTRNGVRLEVPVSLIHIFKEIFMEECYAHGAPLKIHEGMTVFDIGANIGVFTAFAAMKFPKAHIFAYEPIPANFAQLQKNAALNGDCHIVCVNQAVSAGRGEIVLRLAENDFSTTASVSAVARGQALREVRVPCAGIQEIFDDNGLDRCDFLKMDCEGAEYDAIFSCPKAYLKKIDRMAIEMHRGTKPEHNTALMRKYLDDNGFITFETPRALAMLYAWRESAA